MDPESASVWPDSCDLVLCSVPRQGEDGRAREALLDAAHGCAKRVGVLLFETVWDGRTAEQRDELPDDLKRLRSSFAFVHTVSESNDGGTPGRRVLLFCSNRYWYADGHLGAFDSWTSHSSEMTGQFRRGTRRYFFCADTIVKSYCFCGSAAQDNRREIEREISFLLKPPIEDASIPRLIGYHIGGYDGILVMERLPGILLTTAVLQEIDYNPALVLRGVLERLYALERVGLYHNDVGQWNILVDEDGGSVLIDFASVTGKLRSHHWPHDPILHFFLFAQTVIRRRFLSSPMGIFPITPFGLPRQYRRWAARVWSKPRGQHSFALLKTCFEAAVNGRPLHQRQTGVTGRLYRWFRRFLYSRALIELQMRSFVERVRIVTIGGIIRYARAAIDRSSLPRRAGLSSHPGCPD
jgi:predicted Ser/Thr protein kinase